MNPLIGGGRAYLAMELNDGCVSLHVGIVTEPDQGGSTWELLDSLLAEITVEKHLGAVSGPPLPRGYGYSGIVRRR